MDDDSVMATTSSDTVIYVMWAGDFNGEHTSPAVVTELMDLIIRSCSGR